MAAAHATPRRAMPPPARARRTPSGPCVGPRCAAKYARLPSTAVTMSTSGRLLARIIAEVAPAVRAPRPARTSVTPTSVCVRLSNQTLIYQACARPPPSCSLSLCSWWDRPDPTRGALRLIVSSPTAPSTCCPIPSGRSSRSTAPSSSSDRSIPIYGAMPDGTRSRLVISWTLMRTGVRRLAICRASTIAPSSATAPSSCSAMARCPGVPARSTGSCDATSTCRSAASPATRSRTSSSTRRFWRTTSKTGTCRFTPCSTTTAN